MEMFALFTPFYAIPKQYDLKSRMPVIRQLHGAFTPYPPHHSLHKFSEYFSKCNHFTKQNEGNNLLFWGEIIQQTQSLHFGACFSVNSLFTSNVA